MFNLKQCGGHKKADDWDNMRETVSLSRNKEVYRVLVSAAFGRCLREEYNADQLLPEGLVALVRKIEELPEQRTSVPNGVITEDLAARLHVASKRRIKYGSDREP